MRQENGSWAEHDVAVVRPYVHHQIASPDHSIAVIVVEPESIDPSQLPCHQEGARRFNGVPVLAGRVRALLDDFTAGASQQELFSVGLERVLYGAALRPKPLDPRIGHVVSLIRDQPLQRHIAENCAQEVNLSFSRFLHLFKQEMGVPFRRYQAWRRARNVIGMLVTNPTNLTDVALDGGYPDSTHFSHTVKQVYGLRPRDIVAGSRQLEVFDA
ncbi:AraC family transcriptional regulator [Burkholderia sp. BCC1977]|uniref:helix-turn-helix transcriptional regulator n=1 Tax=Burkholderia sp. BCC1977 TaxID=2817440 RepID=UPI002ABDAE3C|nr:AraC family transcriptional regulator [Burkholderia sp. BCC1977]